MSHFFSCCYKTRTLWHIFTNLALVIIIDFSLDIVVRPWSPDQWSMSTWDQLTEQRYSPFQQFPVKSGDLICSQAANGDLNFWTTTIKHYVSVEGCRKYLKKNGNEPLPSSQGHPSEACRWRGKQRELIWLLLRATIALPALGMGCWWAFAAVVSLQMHQLFQQSRFRRFMIKRTNA